MKAISRSLSNSSLSSSWCPKGCLCEKRTSLAVTINHRASCGLCNPNFVYILTFEWFEGYWLPSVFERRAFRIYVLLIRTYNFFFFFQSKDLRKWRPICIISVQMLLCPNFQVGMCILETRFFFFFLLNLPDKVLLINKIFPLVPPMVDERENWISEELILVKMDIIPHLLTDLWSANISIDISSWLFHPFLENIRESVKCQFVGKLFVYTHSERFYFLDRIVTAVSVYQFDIAFSNEIQSKFWTSSGKCGDLCPDSTAKQTWM